MSEFGSGLAICLLKFAEHAGHRYARRIESVHTWHLVPEQSYDDEITRDVGVFQIVELKCAKGNYAKAMSNLIEMWANGASDHLYDIRVPDEWKKTKLARLVKKLKDKGLAMGHGFERHDWTYEDFIEVHNLARQVALALDRKIGLKRVDEGDW